MHYRQLMRNIYRVGSPDFIIDAIDNINTKLYLIKYCHDRSLPVVSSMGAGAKADPSRIQIADISETLGNAPVLTLYAM